MGNVALAYPDYMLATYYTVSASGGDWLASMPLANLKDPLRALLTRSTDDAEASTQFVVDFGVARTHRFLDILNSNLSFNATIRYEFFSDAGLTTLVHDTTAMNVWPNTHPTLEELNGYKPDFWFCMAANASSRYCRVKIADTNNPDGYVELSRAGFRPIWQPGINIEYGCSVGWTDPDTTKERAPGSGTDWFDQKDKRRLATVSFPVLSDSEAFKDIMEMNRRLGLSGEVFFCFDPSDTDWYYKQKSFLSRMKELSPLTIPDYGHNKAGYSFEELL